MAAAVGLRPMLGRSLIGALCPWSHRFLVLKPKKRGTQQGSFEVEVLAGNTHRLGVIFQTLRSLRVPS